MALRKERLAFVGCGMMGEAMVKGLLHQSLVKPGQITTSNPRPERAADLAQRYGVRALTDNADACEGATVVAITVKPQALQEVISDLKGKVHPDALILTIVAGARMADLANVLGAPAVVRIMPNTPAQIGRGMSVWTATDHVDDDGRQKARTMLSALGEEEYVSHENELDMATALSGTGPAYAFLFMEALIDSGVHLGFSRRVASRLVIETVRGAVEYAAEAPEHLAKMRNQVTSPGGTTAEAAYQLEKGGMRTVLSDAVWAAYRRCVQLGKSVGPADNGRPLDQPGGPSR
ncbi:MAG: pyrroline-5-carboxylate reductase [bacterium]|nr:pyrroline-5-carboxylate reductase [bacterium]